MTIQEYELKFNHLSRYAPHMVVYSRDQMNKFLYGVSDFVKTECRNAILLGDMNISRIMTHAQQLRVIILGNMIRRIKKLGLGSMTILNKKRVVEIACRVGRSFQLQPIDKLVFRPPRIATTRRVEH